MKRIDEILPGVPDPLAGMTPEQIAERDAAITAEREQAAKFDRQNDWQRRKNALMERGLSQLHLKKLYDGGLEPTPAIHAIENLPATGLICLSGNPGCGKTLAAHGWLVGYPVTPPSEWKSSQVRMVTAAEFARTSRYGSEKFAVLSEPQKLVIDDLGVEYADNSASYLVDLDELLDLRWKSEKATLLTTNLSLDDFKARYRERIYDRLKGKGRWRHVKHSSLRGQE